MFPIIAAVALMMHGLANSSGFMAAWLPGTAGFSNRPWLLSPGVSMKSLPGYFFGLLWLLTTLALVAAGIGIFGHASWWRWSAIAGSGLSLLIIILWWNTVPPGARFGAFFDLVVLIALALPWGESVVRFLHP